jgi:DNA repair protein RecO (recombination protein O)
MLARGRSLDTVSQAETLEGHTALRSDLDRTARGLYCAELLDAVLPEESPQPQAFTLFIRILSWLDEGESDLLLRWFELHLLAVAGFKPELQQCAECGGPLSPEGCSFSVDAGGVLCSACRASAGGEERRGPVISITLNALKTLRYLQDNDYAEARRLRVLASLAAEVEGALRLYIRHILERDVRSTAFLDHLRRGLST